MSQFIKGDMPSPHLGRDSAAEPAPSSNGSRPARQLRFSTNGIPPTNRLELWELHNAKALIPLDIRTMDEAPLQASEISLGHGALRFGGVSGSAQVVERSESFIRRNRTDEIAIFFTLKGEAFFHHRDGHELIKPGQAIICDADRPFMRGFSTGLKEMVLTIPRADYLELSAGEQLTGPRVLDFTHGESANQQLRALAGVVGDALSGQNSELRCPESSVKDLLALVVSGGGSASGSGYLTAARRYIDEHLGETDLNASRIAPAIGVSERHLSRIFAAQGLSPGSYIRGRRLELAREILIDAESTSPTVGTLARQFGFTSQSYFTRAFKAQYGTTPLELRHRAKQEPVSQ